MSVVALVIAPSISLDNNKISKNFVFDNKLKKNEIYFKDFNDVSFTLNKNLEIKGCKYEGFKFEG